MGRRLTRDRPSENFAATASTSLFAIQWGGTAAEFSDEFYNSEVPANMCRLANTHSRMGNHQLALPLHQEALGVQSRLLDTDDVGVLLSRGDLANCHAQMGDHRLALPIYMDVLERERRVLGSEHPYTLTDAGNCAETLCTLGDHAAAVPLFREAVAGMAALHGDESPGR